MKSQQHFYYMINSTTRSSIQKQMAQLTRGNQFFARRVKLAFLKAGEELGAKYRETIEDPNAFPEFPGQDIVDRGDLRDSQKMTIIGDSQIQFSWDVLYAIYVLNGYTLRNGKVQPGRNWISQTHKSFNFELALIKHLGQTLIRGK